MDILNVTGTVSESGVYDPTTVLTVVGSIITVAFVVGLIIWAYNSYSK